MPFPDFKNTMIQSLLRGELWVAYQPQVTLKTNEILVLEALIRWHHPTLGVIPPSNFIPSAVRLQLSNHISRFVLSTVCRDALLWPDKIRVAVNVSARQISETQLMIDIESALGSSGLKPERLELEVTEDLPIEDPEKFLRAVERISRLGITVAIDDFGVEFSNFSTLCRGNFSKIKMDRSFTGGFNDDRSKAIAKAIAQLGRELSMITVAEGVESNEQLKIVQSLGFSLGQGYFLGHPMAVEAVSAFLRNYPESLNHKIGALSAVDLVGTFAAGRHA